MCRIDDYMVAKRCFKCSIFNHTHKECKGTEACPLCTGNHKLKACTTPKTEHKCINCQTYNRHHAENQVDTVHSALDKACLSLMAILERYRKNTDY